MKPRVLTTGLAKSLVMSRLAVLRTKYDSEGCQPSEVVGFLENQDFDLLLVCHSIPHRDATHLIDQVHSLFPELRIVRLLTASSPEIDEPVADRNIIVNYHPQIWMDAVGELLSGSV